jgi:hypothetical protein
MACASDVVADSIGTDALFDSGVAGVISGSA